MENASKALLIAAAVLIAIVLIALGVGLLNSGSDVTEQAGTVSESTSIRAFNAQFESYKGKKNGNSVKSLLQAVLSNNKTNTSNKVDVYVGDGNEGEFSDQTTKLSDFDYDSTFLTTAMSEVKVNATYKLVFEYDEEGRIKLINIYGKEDPQY